jgi:hypothetical protein
LAAAIKARWVCEQAHQQLKEELGLDHFEGRSWVGLHHHALLTQIAFAFLQHLRLRDITAERGRGKNATHPPSDRSAADPDAADGAAADRAATSHRRTPLPKMPWPAHVRATRTSVDVAE